MNLRRMALGPESRPRSGPRAAKSASAASARMIVAWSIAWPRQPMRLTGRAVVSNLQSALNEEADAPTVSRRSADSDGLGVRGDAFADGRLRARFRDLGRRHLLLGHCRSGVRLSSVRLSWVCSRLVARGLRRCCVGRRLLEQAPASHQQQVLEALRAAASAIFRIARPPDPTDLVRTSNASNRNPECR